MASTAVSPSCCDITHPHGHMQYPASEGESWLVTYMHMPCIASSLVPSPTHRVREQRKNVPELSRSSSPLEGCPGSGKSFCSPASLHWCDAHPLIGRAFWSVKALHTCLMTRHFFRLLPSTIQSVAEWTAHIGMWCLNQVSMYVWINVCIYSYKQCGTGGKGVLWLCSKVLTLAHVVLYIYIYGMEL